MKFEVLRDSYDNLFCVRLYTPEGFGFKRVASYWCLWLRDALREIHVTVRTMESCACFWNRGLLAECEQMLKDVKSLEFFLLNYASSGRELAMYDASQWEKAEEEDGEDVYRLIFEVNNGQVTKVKEA